jgi:hypothetical protein
MLPHASTYLPWLLDHVDLHRPLEPRFCTCIKGSGWREVIGHMVCQLLICSAGAIDVDVEGRVVV